MPDRGERRPWAFLAWNAVTRAPRALNAWIEELWRRLDDLPDSGAPPSRGSSRSSGTTDEPGVVMFTPAQLDQVARSGRYGSPGPPRPAPVSMPHRGSVPVPVRALAPAPAAPAPAPARIGRRGGRPVALIAGVLFGATASLLVLATVFVVVGSQRSPAPTPATRPWPGTTTGLPLTLVAHGPGVDTPGTDLVVAPGPASSLEVYERVLLAGADPGGLALRLADLRADPRMTVGRGLAATAVQVTANGRPATVVSTGGSWVVVAANGAPLHRAVVRYTLTSAVVLAAGAIPGRALLLVTPLTTDTSLLAEAPTVVHAEGVRVRGMTCPLADPADRVCGSIQPTGWVARIPISSDLPLVTVQVELLR